MNAQVGEVPYGVTEAQRQFLDGYGRTKKSNTGNCLVLVYLPFEIDADEGLKGLGTPTLIQQELESII